MLGVVELFHIPVMPSELIFKTVGGGALENPAMGRCRRCKMPQGVESLRQKDKAIDVRGLTVFISILFP